METMLSNKRTLVGRGVNRANKRMKKLGRKKKELSITVEQEPP